MRPVLVAAVLCAVLVVARGALDEDGHGGEPKPRGWQGFSTHRQEAEAIFDRLDRNHDGSLSSEEVGKQVDVASAKELLHGMPSSTFMILADENGDRMVTKDEYEAWYADHAVASRKHAGDWEDADADKDGQLTLEEFLSSRVGKKASTTTSACPANFNAGPADTFCHSHSDEGLPSAGRDSAEHSFEHMDRDSDGLISKKEWDTYFSPDYFASADRDGDGVVEMEEHLTAPKHWRAYTDRSNEEIQEEFEQMDVDKDGRVTRQEFEDHSRAEILRGRHLVEEEAAQDIIDTDAENTDSQLQDQWVSFGSPLIAPSSKVPQNEYKNDMTSSVDDASVWGRELPDTGLIAEMKEADVKAEQSPAANRKATELEVEPTLVSTLLD